MSWEIINFGFKRDDKFYIGTTKYGAQWVEDKNKCKITFEKSSSKLAINFLLDQYFFSVKNSFFHHVIGISMGSAPARFMAIFFIIIMKIRGFFLLRKVT